MAPTPDARPRAAGDAARDGRTRAEECAFDRRAFGRRTFDRRTFVRAGVRAGATALALAFGVAPRAAPAGAVHSARGTLRLWLADAPDPTAAAALAFGADEAARSAAPFGLHVTLAAADAALAAVRAGDAVVGGTTAAACERLARAARARGAVYVNPWCDDDALRAAACDAWTVHVAPSARMRRAALAAAPAADAGDAGTRRALAWHASLEKYGAAQLAARYRAAAGRAMDEPAWAAWAAAKLLAEAALRARPGEALGARLARPDFVVDAHKGAPLRVRAADRQLEQPLYVVAGGPGAAERVVAEVPHVEGAGEEDRAGGVRARLAAFGAPDGAGPAAPCGARP